MNGKYLRGMGTIRHDQNDLTNWNLLSKVTVPVWGNTLRGKRNLERNIFYMDKKINRVTDGPISRPTNSQTKNIPNEQHFGLKKLL